MRQRKTYTIRKGESTTHTPKPAKKAAKKPAKQLKEKGNVEAAKTPAAAG